MDFSFCRKTNWLHENTYYTILTCEASLPWWSMSFLNNYHRCNICEYINKHMPIGIPTSAEYYMIFKRLVTYWYSMFIISTPTLRINIYTSEILFARILNILMSLFRKELISAGVRCGMIRELIGDRFPKFYTYLRMRWYTLSTLK